MSWFNDPQFNIVVDPKHGSPNVGLIQNNYILKIKFQNLYHCKEKSTKNKFQKRKKCQLKKHTKLKGCV